MNETGLMLLEQAPIIREKLANLKAEIDSEVSEALSLVCTEETVKTVKEKRAELNKRLQMLEEQRKAIKKGVLEPYEAFETVYKECVSDALKQADIALKGKIDDVENEIKARCETELRDYFAEVCAVYHTEWLDFEQCGIKIGLAEAKQKSYTKLKDAIALFVERVFGEVDAISKMENATEIMVEYKQTLDLAQSISIVKARHEQMEAELAAKEQLAEAEKREAEAVAKVEAAIEVALPTEAPKTYTATFTVHATMEQLKALKAFMSDNNIIFE